MRCSFLSFASIALKLALPIFLENKNGKAKIVSFYAKKARGAMARFVVQNRLKTKDDLKGFAAGGYCYQPDQSDADHLVFEREASV